VTAARLTFDKPDLPRRGPGRDAVRNVGIESSEDLGYATSAERNEDPDYWRMSNITQYFQWTEPISGRKDQGCH